ncbi:MAG: hypothetical protein AAF108_00080 [Planctomycetota bacterium]
MLALTLPATFVHQARIILAALLLTAAGATPAQDNPDAAPGSDGIAALVERLAEETDPAALQDVAESLREAFPDGLPDNIRDQIADQLPDGLSEGLADQLSEAVGGSASSLADSAEKFLQDPSFGAVAATVAVVGGSLLGGLVLWAAGKKMVRPVFGLVGAAAGGLLGAVLLPATGLGAQLPVSLPPTWVGLAAGAIVGILFALAAFRFSLAIIAGLTGLALALLISVVAVGLQHVPTQNAKPLTPKQLLLEGVPVDDEDAPTGDTAARETTTDQQTPSSNGTSPTTDQARAFATEVVDHLRTTYWEPTPVWKKSTVIASAFFGFIGGLAVGVLMPKRSTAVVTALAGAGLWIPPAVALAARAGAPTEWFQRSPEQWLAIWLVVSALGVVVQLTLGKKKRKRDDA